MSDRTNRIAHDAINVGLAANVVLAVLKTAFGIIGHSDALLADGINSTSDVAYYVVVKVFMLLASRPPDREHPYGHTQLESIAALAVGSFVITTAIALFWDAINTVYDMAGSGVPERISLVTLWIALATVVLKIVLTLYTRRAAARAENAAVLALAYDHRNDILTAGGAAVGIMVSRLGYSWADPLVGGVVAVIVLLTGIQILREASADLMDAVPSEALDRRARTLLHAVPGIEAVEEMQAHRFGPYLVMNITIGIDGSVSVHEGHRIASDAERALCDGIGLVRRVYVHYHPVEEPGRGGAPPCPRQERNPDGRGIGH